MSHIFSLFHIFNQLYRICINEKCLFSSISHLQDQLKGKSPNHKCKTNFQITWQMFVIFRVIEAALFAPENEKSIKTGLLGMASLQKVDIAHLQAFHAFSDEISAIVVDGRNFHLDTEKRFYKKVTARKLVSVLIFKSIVDGYCAYVELSKQDKKKLAEYIAGKRDDIEDEERDSFFVGGEKRVVNDVIDELATYYFEYMMVMCNSEKGSAEVFRFTHKFMDGSMKTLRELTPEMLVMTEPVSCIHSGSDVKEIPMDFETCLNEILHPSGLPDWNFCKPLPFAIAFMGNVEKRKEVKRKKRKQPGTDDEADESATSSSPTAQVLRRSDRITTVTPRATVTACKMVECAILEYDHHETTQARRTELFHLITWSLQQHTNGNPNDLWIDPVHTKTTYDGLASFAKTSDPETKHDVSERSCSENDDNDASNNDKNASNNINND